MKRTAAALDARPTSIVCVGERLEQRESGQTGTVLTEQFHKGIGPLTPSNSPKS